MPSEARAECDSPTRSDGASGCKTLRCSQTISLGLVTRLVATMEDALVLQTGEPAFHRRIIPAIPFATHARNRLHVRDQRLKVMAAVLAAAVAVVNQSPFRFSLGARRPKCV